jgi:long-subunit fatty acid transport protein
MGGIGLNVGYYVTDEIRIRCGYDVLFLSNLALADQQLQGFSNGLYQVQTNGSAVIHGANLGLEFAF